MKFINYLKSNKNYIILYFVFLIIFNINIYIDPGIKMNNDSLLYLNTLFLTIFILFIVFDFFKKRIEFEKILEMIKTIDNVDINDNYVLESELIYEIKKEHLYWMDKIKNIENELKEVNDYMTDWVHQVKIPISILEIISERIDDIQISKDINREVKRINSLVEQALYTSRSGEYSSDFSIEEVELDKIIRNVIKKNKYLFIYNKLELNMSSIDISVYTDKKWISHIIELIIDNACKYSSIGGKIEIFQEISKKAKIIHIKDYGEGISKSDIDRVFDKGFTGKNGRNRFKSTGMGLYISKKILNALGDNISIDYVEGKYCDVSIIFNKEHDLFDVIK